MIGEKCRVQNDGIELIHILNCGVESLINKVRFLFAFVREKLISIIGEGKFECKQKLIKQIFRDRNNVFETKTY